MWQVWLCANCRDDFASYESALHCCEPKKAFKCEKCEHVAFDEEDLQPCVNCADIEANG